MIITNTKINTTIPGMEGYKSVENSDKIKKAQSMYDKFGWILKG